MYKKGQQLETALEARRYMVSHPRFQIKPKEGV